MALPSDPYDSISPIDYRYYEEEFRPALSEHGFTFSKLEVEQALVRVLRKRGICTDDDVEDIRSACLQVTTKGVYREEDRIHHDIRALVNEIRAGVSEETKRFVHLTATSYDIVDTANALRYKAAVKGLVLPYLIELEKCLINIVIREVDTAQIGRTHGQHAVPISFGFAIAQYVSRLGICIENLTGLAEKLTGKFSGAVGAYNASSLFFDDPEEFEKEVLAELELVPAEISTQIAPPEAVIRLFCELTLVAGVMANLADDMRHLQRTEIGEVGEEFEEDQVGSSTMPQKRNPVNFENVKSIWKTVLPRVLTPFLDQISEHQRDLTNSASSRTYGEIIAYIVTTAERMTKAMSKLKVDKDNMKRNLELTKGMIVAEPLYIILAGMGHTDAHEKVRQLTLVAQRERRPLEEVAGEDMEVNGYIERMTEKQRSIIANPTAYTGIAAEKARKVALNWQARLGYSE